MKKEVGCVTPEERDEIQSLFERKNGLNELAKVLTSDNNELYERLIRDLGDTNARFQDWWDRMSLKYAWESSVGGSWEIDFQSGIIYLVD